MRYAFCSEVFATPIEETIRRLADIGFDGIEIAPFNLAESVDDIPPRRRAGLRKAAEDAGIEIVGFHWLLASPKRLHITTPDNAIRERSWNYLKSVAVLCADLGAKVMVLGSPEQRNLVPGDRLDAAIERVVEPLRELGKVCSRHNVKLLLEPLDSDQTDFLDNVEDVIRLLHRVDHPQIGYMLDTRALSKMSGGILANIHKYGQGAGHYHANEPSALGPGMGDFDFRPVLAALRDVHFFNWVSVEPFDYKPNADTVARTALETLRAAEEGAS